MDMELVNESSPSQKIHSQHMPMQSDDLKDLFTALAKAQGEMRVAGNRSENPFFKSRYADLAEIVNASRPALTKNGLSVIQRILPNDDGQNLIHTMLCHGSGQFITSLMRVLPVKNDMQSLGSCLTYLRRYAYAALIGVITADEDDDGERAMVEVREVSNKGTSLNTKYNPKEQSNDTITREQLDELEYELAEYPDIAEQVIEGLRIHVLADMPKSKFLASINRIRSIKAARNGK